MSSIRSLIAAAAVVASSAAWATGELWNGFVNPDDQSRTKVWWFHGETETTEEGIDADLEGFKEAGIGGVVFYDQTHGNQEGACPALSPRWWETLRHAALRARELGLTFAMASTNGYVAGGPWITPDLSMKKIVTLRPGEPRPEGFVALATVAVPVISGEDFTDTLMVSDRITLLNNETLQLAVDFGRPKEVRTISYTARPRGKGAYGSMHIPGPPQDP